MRLVHRLPALVLLAAPLAAQAAPAQLMNKSVVISWTDSAQEKEGERVFTEQINRQRIAYISSAGRVFVKSINSGKGGNGNQREITPGSDKGALAFQGNTLVGYAANPGFARRLTVSFDAGFSSCTASVVYGKSGGKQTWKSFDGKRTFELLSLSASAASCSIREGNAVAQ